MSKGTRVREERTRAATMAHRAAARDAYLSDETPEPVQKFAICRRERRMYATKERQKTRRETRAARRS